MQTQNQRHISWKPKKDTFGKKISSSNKWNQSVFVPKYINKEENKEENEEEKTKEKEKK